MNNILATILTVTSSSLAGLVFVPYCALFTPKYYPLKK